MNHEDIEQQRTPNRSPGRWVELAWIAAVVAAGLLDAVIPPAGIPASILVIWIYLRKTGRTWGYLGLGRPGSWPRTIVTAIAVTIVLQALSITVLLPLIQSATGITIDMSRFDAFKGNVGMLVKYLVVSWTTAGIGEEIIWRGFLMLGLVGIIGDNRAGRLTSLAIMGVVFGGLHAYQGPVGVLMTGWVGITLGAIVFLNRRNLWMAILIHALLDTTSFLLLFLGLDV